MCEEFKQKDFTKCIIKLFLTNDNSNTISKTVKISFNRNKINKQILLVNQQ